MSDNAEVKRLAGVMPRYFGIWSATGVHVGVWEDGYIAGKVLAEGYLNGTMVEMVSVHDAGNYVAAKLAEVEAERDACMDDLEQALGQRDDAAAVAHRAETHIAHLENHIEGVAKDTHKIMVAYEAALPAVYRLGLEDAAAYLQEQDVDLGPWSETVICSVLADEIRRLPTPTAAELMARINKGDRNG